MVDSRSLGITRYQLFCACAATIGSLNFGWNLGVINIPGVVISKCVDSNEHSASHFPECIPTSDTIWGIAAGSLGIGALLGGLFGIPLSDRLGRKRTLFWFCLFSFFGGIILALSTNITMIIVGRVLVGISAGASNGTLSTYTAETTTPKARNILGYMPQLGVSVGIFLSQIISLGMSKPPVWRALFSVTSLISLINMTILWLCVESPRWLIMKGCLSEALDSLTKLRAGSDCSIEFEEMTTGINGGAGAETKHTNIISVVTGKIPDNLTHQLIVVNTLMILQQASGIVGIVFYSTVVFDRVLPSSTQSLPTMAQILTGVLSAVALIATIGGMTLAKYFGRRVILITSHSTIGIFSTIIVIGNVTGADRLVIAMIFLFYVFFIIGSGPIPWTIPGEITPAYAAATVSAIASSVNFTTLFAMSIAFAPIQSALGDYTFLIFMAINIFGALFCYFFLPETKDRNISDIARIHSGKLHNVTLDKYKL